MIQPLILSDSNEDEARDSFTKYLEEPFTCLVFMGTHPSTENALANATEKINSGSIYYISVRAVHAPKPEYILPVLFKLRVNPDLPAVDWCLLNLYSVLSLTNMYRNIAGIFTVEEIAENTGGKINKLVRWAYSLDKSFDSIV